MEHDLQIAMAAIKEKFRSVKLVFMFLFQFWTGLNKTAVYMLTASIVVLVIL